MIYKTHIITKRVAGYSADGRLVGYTKISILDNGAESIINIEQDNDGECVQISLGEWPHLRKVIDEMVMEAEKIDEANGG